MPGRVKRAVDVKISWPYNCAKMNQNDPKCLQLLCQPFRSLVNPAQCIRACQGQVAEDKVEVAWFERASSAMEGPRRSLQVVAKILCLGLR